jgi:hypothetical protein
MATFAVHEKSQEANRLRLFVASMKRETAAVELPATEAQALLAGKTLA